MGDNVRGNLNGVFHSIHAPYGVCGVPPPATRNGHSRMRAASSKRARPVGYKCARPVGMHLGVKKVC